MIAEGADTTFDDAIRRLNRKSLRSALTTASFLSALEYAGHSSSPLFPSLNNEKTRLIAEAAIRSRSAWYKDEPVIPKDLPILLNGALTASDDHRLDEISSDRPRQEMLYDLQKYFSRLAYVQIRPQQNQGIALGQLLAVTERLPHDHWQELPPEIQNVAQSFPQAAQQALGESPSNLIRAATLLLSYLTRVGETFLTHVPTPPSFQKQRWQAEQLYKLVGQAGAQVADLAIHRSAFERMLTNAGLSCKAEPFLRVFSGLIDDLRKLYELPHFNLGPEGHRLSPLDRFPVVLADDGAFFVIPNARKFCAALSSVVHFSLNELCRESYERVRGHCLELYFRRVLSARAPTLLVIPEKKWATGKGNIAGPDLTIIDHGEHPMVLGIEIKFRRMLPNTRFELRDEDIKSNYSDLWSALTKLDGKLDQVLAGRGDYSQYRSDLERARKYPRRLLGVTGEAPFMFAELANALADRDSDFPLHGVSKNWSVMGAETFERFIEASVQHAIPLLDLFDQYLSESTNLELSGGMAEAFGNMELDLSQSYAASFL